MPGRHPGVSVKHVFDTTYKFCQNAIDADIFEASSYMFYTSYEYTGNTNWATFTLFDRRPMNCHCKSTHVYSKNFFTCLTLLHGVRTLIM